MYIYTLPIRKSEEEEPQNNLKFMSHYWYFYQIILNQLPLLLFFPFSFVTYALRTSKNQDISCSLKIFKINFYFGIVWFVCEIRFRIFAPTFFKLNRLEWEQNAWNHVAKPIYTAEWELNLYFQLDFHV